MPDPPDTFSLMGSPTGSPVARAADDVLDELSRVARSQRGSLAAIARSEGATAEDAVDCVQEGLCTLLELAQRGAATLDGDDARAMLATIVRNVARNRRRRHFLARPHEDLDAAERPDTGQPGADESIARAEEHVRLRACVEELCAIQKAVVTLRLLEEQPGEDVAGALGISTSYVAVLLHRAKRELRACMTTATGTGGGPR
ncbi:MAG TPA: sigma-70 family RNA polymerase sigma factor [Polyangiaceae bacterium]|jgi:RNA polymerase sigma-70 factor (ECF subfamily)|nr:sigma-70 family RNA polymerase sigma factor [Polyangiaceae bacterium]